MCAYVSTIMYYSPDVLTGASVGVNKLTNS